VLFSFLGNLLGAGRTRGSCRSPNTEPDLAGYKLYYGNASWDYAQVIDVGNTTMYTVTNLTAGDTYYFAVAAHDTSGYESEHSIIIIDGI
jgi:fibronectin type 3 domain-containing protein